MNKIKIDGTEVLLSVIRQNVEFAKSDGNYDKPMFSARTVEALLDTLRQMEKGPNGKDVAYAIVTSDEMISNPPGSHTFASITVTSGTFFSDELVNVVRDTFSCGTFDINALTSVTNSVDYTDSLTGDGAIVLDKILLRKGDILTQRGVEKG